MNFKDKATEIFGEFPSSYSELGKNRLDKDRVAGEGKYENFISKWHKELGIDFNIDDTVYHYKDNAKKVSCPMCNGARMVNATITTANNKIMECKVNCPTCKGFGIVRAEKEYTVEEAEIEEIEVIISERKAKAESRVFRNIWIRDKSGTDRNLMQIRSEDLYMTKEECEEAIKTLNRDKDRL